MARSRLLTPRRIAGLAIAVILALLAWKARAADPTEAGVSNCAEFHSAP